MTESKISTIPHHVLNTVDRSQRTTQVIHKFDIDTCFFQQLENRQLFPVSWPKKETAEIVPSEVIIPKPLFHFINKLLTRANAKQVRLYLSVNPKTGWLTHIAVGIISATSLFPLKTQRSVYGTRLFCVVLCNQILLQTQGSIRITRIRCECKV